MTKNSNNNKKAHAFKRAAALITAALMAALVFTGCPQTPTVQKVTITITGDEGVTVNEPKTLEVAKGTKWSEVKAKVKVSYKDGYEAKGFKLDGASGQDLEDGYAFNENKTVFALSKPKTNTSYKVEHLQQNAEDNGYTLKETEEKTGKKGENTAAAAKTYDGFTVQPFSQAAIKADGSTVVQIKYNRNIITLKLNLTGGTTTTPLTDGEGGIKLLKGKYGAKVELKNLKKGSNTLDKWEPKLPATFPASSPDTTYVASWTNQYRITVKGDERTSIPSSLIEIDLAPAKTWHDIQGDVANKVILKPEWSGSDYEVYEWRLDDENGTKLTDDYQIKSHITVYAVTNYAKFNIDSTKTKIKLTAEGKGYTGAAPKGKIIIPDGITEIGGGLFTGAFRNCTEISSVKFPQTLTTIGEYAFSGCTGLTSISLSGCTSLTTIGEYAFYHCTGLTEVKLPASLTKIGGGVFTSCTALKSINLPASLNSIGSGAFSNCKGLTNLTVDSGNINYKAVDNIIYTKNGETLVAAARGLKTASILNTITKIDGMAFEGAKLESIDLSACTSLNKIDWRAFGYCTGLTEVKLPASINSIGNGAFAFCTGLTNLTVDNGNIKYKAVDNIIYTKNGETLVAAAGGLKTVSILNTITKIDKSAFEGAKLESIDLSALTSLTKISDTAFYCCAGLTEVKLPASLTKIGWRAFSGYTSLTSAVFADTTGWAVYDNDSYSGTPTPISSSDLAAPATAARYLRDTYDLNSWKKN